MVAEKNNFSIEILTEKYIPAVAEFYAELAVFIKEYTHDEYFNFTSLSTSELEQDLKSNLVNTDTITYVAILNDNPVGFISGSITRCFLPISKIKNVGYISGAFIREEFRNH